MIMLFNLYLSKSLKCFHATFVFYSMLWFGSIVHTSIGHERVGQCWAGLLEERRRQGLLN